MSARVIVHPRRRAQVTMLTAPTTIQRIKLGEQKPVALCWSPLGTFLAVAIQHGAILLYYLLPDKKCALRTTPIRKYTGHSADVLHMCFSRSNFLLSASMDRCVRLWHTDTALCLRRFVHPDMVTAVSFHPTDENYVISGGCDGVARIWRPVDHACVSQSNLGSVITVAQFCEQGKQAYIGCYDGSISVLDVSDVTNTSSMPHPNVRELQRAPIGNEHDISVTHSPVVQRTVNLKATRRKRRASAKVLTLRVNARTQQLWALSADGRVHVVNEQGRNLHRWRVGVRKDGREIGGSLSADARWMVVDGVGDALRVLDVAAVEREQGVRVERLQLGGGDVCCAAFATDGAVKRGGFSDTREPLVMAVGHDDGFLSVAYCEYAS